MNHHDISTADALRRLSSPPERFEDPTDREGLSRRRFLQAVGAGMGGVMAGGVALPGVLGWDDHMAEAAPVKADEGILVLVGMYGGNDGLRMVAPIGDSNYERLRERVKVTPEDGLPLGGGYALAPELTHLKSRWDAGEVAIVHGVGYPSPNLSHFSSMAYWMSGRPNGVPSSGWIGRWLDEFPADLFRSVTIGSSIPLHMQGVRRRSISVPHWGIGFGGLTEPEHLRAYAALKKMAKQPARRGPWATALGTVGSNAIDVAQRVAPVFENEVTAESEIAQQLVVAARLINANLGFRVLDAGWGDFDHHSGQLTSHPDRMREFDEAIRRFFETLSPAWRGRVTIMTFSEFGRTPFDNDSDGTDHGEAGPVLLIGDRVAGGFHGQHPDLSVRAIDEDWDQLGYTVDFRRIYATVLDQWLGGGASTVLEGNFPPLALFEGGPRV
jgi:uncharacterized protein (DUF1501 family)